TKKSGRAGRRESLESGDRSVRFHGPLRSVIGRDSWRTSMPAVHRLLLPLFVLIVLLPACDVEFRRQEVRLRHDPGTDVVDLLLVHGELVSDDPENGADAVERLLGGGREFIIGEWPLHVPLDSFEERARETLAGADAEPLARSLAEGVLFLSERLTLVDAGLLEDEGGRLGGWQHFRLREATAVFDRLNGMIDAQVLAADEAGDFALGEDVDERTIALWVDRARDGGGWFGLQDDRLVIEVPASRAVLRRGLASFLAGLAEEGDNVFLRLLQAAASDVDVVSVADERVRVELSGDGAAFAWSIEN